jgi:hypothetical protein
MTEDNQSPETNGNSNNEASAQNGSAPSDGRSGDATQVAGSSRDNVDTSATIAGAPKKVPEAVKEAWRVEKDHGSITRLLTRKGDAVDMSFARGGLGRAFLNLILLVLIFGITGAGIVQYQYEASDTTLERKRLKRQALEEGHLRHQQKKQKSYGILRVESTPDRALVRLQVIDKKGMTSDIDLGKGDAPKSAAGGAIAAANAAKGVKQPKLTPMNIMNLDISKIYVISVEKEGYLPDSFVVGGKHIWIKDSGSGEYKFVKNVEMYAAPCEYWFLYDAEKREEVRYPQNGECEKHYSQATKRQVAVTECTCKAIVPGSEEAEAGKDGEKKAGSVPVKVKVVPAK